MSWKFPIFSFLKKLSGCQTLPTSVSVKYLILSVSESLCQGTREEMYLHRASVWTAIGDRSTFASVLFGIYIPRDKNYNNRKKLDWFITILTSSISENPRTKIFTKMSVAASKVVHINSLENDNEADRTVHCLTLQTDIVSRTKLRRLGDRISPPVLT